MRIFYCECGQKMKVAEEMLGKSGKCVGCGRAITVTEANTESEGAPAPASPGGPPPPPPPPDIGSDLSESPDVEELLEPAGGMAVGEEAVPAPPPPPPSAPPTAPPRAPSFRPSAAPARAAAERAFGIDTILGALDMAFDLRKNVIAIAVGVVCFIGLALLGYVGQAILEDGGGDPEQSIVMGLVVALLMLLWLLACLGMAMGGVARMVTLELDFKQRATVGQGIGFILRQVIGLALVFALLAVGIGLVGVVLKLVLMILLKVPGIGPIVAGALTIPAFLIVLFLVCFALQGVLAPSVMAVENCGAGRAISRLLALIPRAGGRTLAYELMAMSVALPTLIVVFFVFSGALYGATSMSSDVGAVGMSYLRSYLPENPMDSSGFGVRPSRRSNVGLFDPSINRGWRGEEKDEGPKAGVKAGFWLVKVSAGLIGTFFVAFLLVYFTTCLTIIYRAVRQNE